MKKYLISKYDAGTIACHYTVLYSLYSDCNLDLKIGKLEIKRQRR
jgi:hypothetical protein